MRIAAARVVLVVLVACSACKRTPAKRMAPAMVMVVIVEPGASAEQAETELAIPVEEVLAGLPGLAHLHTHAFAGGATIAVEPTPDQDIHAVAMAVNERIAKVLPQLPRDVSPPMVRIATARVPVLRYTLRSSALPAAQVRRWQDQVGRVELERLAGVGEITTCGGALPQISVAIDLPRLRARGKAIEDVVAAVREHGTSIAALHDDALVRDVAVVSDSPVPAPCVAVDRGVPVISAAVYAQSGVDAATVRATVTAKLAEVVKALPAGLTLTVVPTTAIELASDPSPAFARAIRALDPLPDLEGYVAEDGGGNHDDPGVHVVIVPHEGAADRAEHAASTALAAQGMAMRGEHDVMIRFVGEDLATLQAAGEAVAKLPHMQPTARFGLSSAETQVIIDRERIADFEITAAQVFAVLRVLGEHGEEVYATALPAGTIDGVANMTIRTTLGHAPIVVSVPGKLVDNLQLATVTARLGQPIPLAEVVRVQDGTAADIYRDDRRRWVGVRVAAPRDEARHAAESVADKTMEVRVDPAE